MKRLGYRWTLTPKGQYSDGHEREDVVAYRQETFLPQWKEIEPHLRNWCPDGEEDKGPLPQNCRTVVWFHNESVFYAHDRRKKCWVHKTEKAKPYQKGEGASLMVADFVSADYGWLRAPDHLAGNPEEARVFFKPGSGRDGYFTNEEIQAQADKAIDILRKHYPHDNHILVFDNARTHIKRAEDAPSARKMPKNMPKNGKNWGVEVSARDATGKIIYSTDGKPAKTVIQMAPGFFTSRGSTTAVSQSFYFPDGHAHAGIFKGMAQILEERGYGNMSKKRAECKGFKCAPGARDCCCRRMLFEEPDFKTVPSLLETACRASGIDVLFLPKFHCELNFIEQCWGHSKRTYRLNPPSSKEEDLRNNVLYALESVPLVAMRR